MQTNKICAVAIKSFALLVALCMVHQAMAQDATSPYPKMAPVDQYLMADWGAEIALARSAAPESISRDAEVLVLASWFRTGGERQKWFRVYCGEVVDVSTGC